MIRNRLSALLLHKRSRGPKPEGQPLHQIAIIPPWENDYYHYKSSLADVATTNRDIQQLIDKYYANPTYYCIKNLEELLESNCKRLKQIQSWITHFPYSNAPQAELTLERNLVRHFQSSVLTHINTMFVYRRKLTQLIEERNARDNSFNALNNSQNFSFTTVNKSVYDRGESIKEVSSQIEGLNSILRKMGDLVAMQGDLLNRIDENLTMGVTNVKAGREQLEQRGDRETGEGEFTCQGKINKVIVSLYITNLILIILFVIKNL